MKRSIRLAARAHAVALVTSLVCTAVVILTMADGGRHISELILNVVLPLLWFSVSVALASAFYIAVNDAIQRMEQREKSFPKAPPPV